MANLSWRARQLVRKLIPLTVVGALLYGGYTMYRHGAFRRGLRAFPSSMSAFLHRLPYFGSRFRHYNVGNDSHYAVAPAHSRAVRHGRSRRARHRRHHRRHHRR
jgi:hypothetical protein